MIHLIDEIVGMALYGGGGDGAALRLAGIATNRVLPGGLWEPKQRGAGVELRIDEAAAWVAGSHVLLFLAVLSLHFPVSTSTHAF